MTTYRFPVLIEQDEDGLYVGLVPDLKGCHSQAATIAELEIRIKEAIAVCLENGEAPPVQHTFVGVHQVELTV